MNRSLATAAVLVTLAVGGCGSGARGTGAELAGRPHATTSTTEAAAGQRTVPVSRAELAEQARQSAAVAGVIGAGAAGGSSASAGAFDPASHPLAPKNPQPMRQGQPRHPQADTVPVALQVSAASCATVGSTLKVTITSEPDVDVAAIVGFSDGESHGAQGLGTTGVEGQLVLYLEIASEAPTGDADLLVVAAAPDQRRNHAEAVVKIVKGTCG